MTTPIRERRCADCLHWRAGARSQDGTVEELPRQPGWGDCLGVLPPNHLGIWPRTHADDRCPNWTNEEPRSLLEAMIAKHTAETRDCDKCKLRMSRDDVCLTPRKADCPLGDFVLPRFADGGVNA